MRFLNINQKLRLLKLQTLAFLHFFSEHFEIAFYGRFYPI